MDLDIGSLIYILVTIVAVIAGIASKKKKPAQGAAAEEGGDESAKVGFFGKLEKQLESFAEDAKGSMENLKQEIIPDAGNQVNTEQAEVDERDYFEKLNDEYEAGAKDDLRRNVATYEGLHSPDEVEDFELMDAAGMGGTDAIELIDIDGDEEEGIDGLKEIEEFDARTAIIYSSIINRIEI